jgi:hypothetical protein
MNLGRLVSLLTPKPTVHGTPKMFRALGVSPMQPPIFSKV